MISSFPSTAANWIWSPDHKVDEVNASFVFTCDFDLSDEHLDKVRLVLTADSRYRVLLNGVWIGDGPVRGFPEEWFYDEYDISSLVQIGRNSLEILVTHLGVSNFQYILAQPGLLAGVSQGDTWLRVTDGSWQVRRATEFSQNVPRTSCQLGFEEHIDLRDSKREWVPAIILATQEAHQHRNVVKRDLPLLSLVTREIDEVVALAPERRIDESVTFHVRYLLSPEPLGCNMLGVAGMVTTQVMVNHLWKGQIFYIGSLHGLFIDGKKLDFTLDQDLYTATISLAPGEHRLSIAFCTRFDHNYEFSLGLRRDISETMAAPLLSFGGEPLTWLTSGPLWTTENLTNCFIVTEDMPPLKACPTFLDDEPRLANSLERAGKCTSLSDIETALGVVMKPVPANCKCGIDAYFQIRTATFGRSLPVATSLGEVDSIPNESCLILDLGDMTNGYVELEFDAAAGTEIILFCFENLKLKEGFPQIQYLQMSALAYRQVTQIVATEGRNRFLSVARRGLRYISLSVRNAQHPVKSIRARVRESTYDVTRRGTFESSDEQLNQMFNIAQRTLLLCMEDTFTDCPTYEQAFWVGDARNEALFAAVTFGAYDLIERGNRLVARSLDRMPLAACQCPSGWDIIIPTFSYLSVLMVWDGYWQTGNLAFLREVYPAVAKTLKNSVKLCSNQGLFTAEAWHFLDWTDIDCGDDRKTVLHDSLFLVGALRAGERMAAIIGEKSDEQLYRESSGRLASALDAQWDEAKAAFPDALAEDGTPSAKSSIHTSLLAVWFDVLSGARREKAIENVITLREDLTPVGSPNAMFYLMEALIRNNQSNLVLQMMRKFWGRMLEEGARTFWEMIYPEGSEFPTRSHCHGWSAAPAYLLPYLFFGMENVEPGWRKIKVRPNLFGLSFVRAEVCTPQGMLQLELRVGEYGDPVFSYDAPTGVEVTVVPS